MSSEWWSSPVRVMIGAGTTWSVDNNRRAAEMLMEEWPTEEGRQYSLARRAVLKAMEHPEDRSAQISARIAFQAAAREADILV